jgi:ketosteroid isomerase-like protein
VGDVGGYFTLVLKKIKGRWLIVRDHTSWDNFWVAGVINGINI